LANVVVNISRNALTLGVLSDNKIAKGFLFAKGRFGSTSLGHVAGDRGHANYLSGIVLNRR
jgi:hypothetical protein